MWKIAVLLTCHNRKDKTLSSLRSLYEALDIYNNKSEGEVISLTTFLTDDGSTDNTAEEVINAFKGIDIHVINGDGNLFWAKGMILAWKAAMNYSNDWDFYLLINDDTLMKFNLFDELVEAHRYALDYFGVGGIYSGVTGSISNPEEVTYGGDFWVDGSYSKTKKLLPNGTPQRCNMTNANIFMVDKSVVDKIGIFYPYKHGGADNDYTIHACKRNIPVLITGEICGLCDMDHVCGEDLRNKLANMSLKERVKYFSSPLHSTHDKLIFTWRNMPLRFPYVWFGRMMDILFPSFYTRLHSFIDKKRSATQ